MPVEYIESYDNFDSILAAMEAGQKQADSKTVEWQAALKPGDFFIRTVEDIPIFCRVLDPAIPVSDKENMSEEDLAEIAADALWYNEPHMRNFRFCHAYSQFCPEGELGDVHVSTALLQIDEEMFLRAKALGWKLS